MRTAGAHDRAVALIGVGNIGSHLLPHLARLPGVGRITLVDPDAYEQHNVESQEIAATDVGRRKVAVQARRAKQIDPTLEVRAIAAAVEQVPLGLLRADVIAAGLDSRAARHAVGRAAARLGVPWVDSGVDGAALLARINAYLPGGDHACIECAVDTASDADLERRLPCAEALSAGAGEARRAAAPTRAPSAIGALAASLAAIEVGKILSGELDGAAVDREILLDARWHRHIQTRTPRNPACAFDHATWQIARLPATPAEISLEAAVRLVPDGVRLRLAGRRFAARLVCAACGREHVQPLVADRWGANRRCAACRARLAPRGFDLVDGLEPGELPPRARRTTLRGLGLRGGDVFTIDSPAGEAHFELAVPRPVARRRATPAFASAGEALR